MIVREYELFKTHGVFIYFWSFKVGNVDLNYG